MNRVPSLDGLSGANLRIVPGANGYVVRKTAATTAGNARLRRQEAKQRAFAALDTPVKAPAIVATGTDGEGRFYFDMEFIGGLDGHRFLERCSPGELHSFTCQLVDHLASISGLPMIGESGGCESLFDACLRKLAEVSHRDAGLPEELAGRILARLGPVYELNLSECGFCHGDFTLENILVDLHGRLHFVDFLDSSFEHPVQDLVKLGQDLDGGWFRMRGKRLSSAVVSHLDQQIQPLIRKSFPYFPAVKDTLQAINFCRILPYVSQESEKSFIIEAIRRFTLPSP